MRLGKSNMYPGQHHQECCLIIVKGGAALGELRFCYKCMGEFDSDKNVCPHCGYDTNSPHNPMYITPGTILHDRYLVGILREFNGEGATYVGHDISTGTKVLLREYMPINLCTRVKGKATISVNYNNLAKYKAFMAEYTELNKSLARLRNNSNINPVLDMFAENNTTYTVFEYIDGVKMLDYLKDNAGELSWEQASAIFPPLFTTIGIVHNAGIIHRAISPDTVYITNKGELKLFGFCISAVRTANAGLEYELFKGYAAPEQYSASSSSRQGSWTDVYGVSALLYRAVTGCMPVDSVSRLKHDDLCEPCRLNNSVPPHISRVIMDGMNLTGRDRIQTITELVTRLFEQPAPPVKPVNRDAAPVPENVQNNYNEPPVGVPDMGYNNAPAGYNNMNSGYGGYDNNAYNNGGYQPPPQQAYAPPPQQQYSGNYDAPPQQYNRRDQEDYRYEEINTVDRIKVPIITALLLAAFLFIIIFIIIKIILPDNGDETATSYYSSTVTNNVVTDTAQTTEPTTVMKEDTEMPNLVGKFYELTEKKYSDFFKFEAIYDYNDEYEKDMIFEQDIKPHTQVAQGCTVKIKVSKGNEGAMIPDYTGLTVSQYENRLKEAGISNYSLIASTNAWGLPNTVTMLQIDGQIVGANSYFSNKEGKKLIVYYMPADAEETPAPTQAQNNYTPAPTQAPAVQATDPPYVAPTDPPAPVQPEPQPTQPPQDVNPGGDSNEDSGNGSNAPEYGMW